MRVSFIIPSFNHAAFLPHAVDSCRNQSHKDIEVIIIDDCSTDTTDQYINWLLKQGDTRIVYKRNEKNMGRSFSRNLGTKISTGDIICINDSDDLSVNQRAEWTIKKLKKTSVCYGSAVFMDAIGIQLTEKTAGPINKERLLKPIDMTKLEQDIEKGNTFDLREIGIVHSTMGLHREIALKYPYADGKISDLGLDDWHVQTRMLRDGVSFDFIPDVLCAYRQHGQAITNTRNPIEVIKMKADILNGVMCE